MKKISRVVVFFFLSIFLTACTIEKLREDISDVGKTKVTNQVTVTLTASQKDSIFTQAVADLEFIKTTHEMMNDRVLLKRFGITESDLRGEYEARTEKLILELLQAIGITPAELIH